MTSARAGRAAKLLALAGLAACAGQPPAPSPFKREEAAFEAAARRAAEGDLEPLVERAWNAEHPGFADLAIWELADALGGPMDREAQAHLVTIFRLHPSYKAVSSLRPAQGACKRATASADGAWCRAIGPMYAPLGEHARPRLFPAEACASLGLRVVEVIDEPAPDAWWKPKAHCVYSDDVIADPDLYGLLRMRDLGRLPARIDGASIPARSGDLLDPARRRSPVRFRVLRYVDGKIAETSSGEPVPAALDFDQLEPEQQAFWRPMFEDLTSFPMRAPTDDRPGEGPFPEIRWPTDGP